MTLTSEYQYIGRSSAVSCDAGWKYYILLYAKTTGSASTGKHTVGVKMRLACDKASTFYGYYTDGSVKVGGVSAISWDGQQVPNTAWKTTSLTEGGVTYLRWVDLKEGTAVIDTAYAQKDVTITSSWSRNSISGDRPSWLPYTTAITASITVTLPLIASASVPTVSASSVTMLDEVTITTNRKSSSLTHDLTWSFGGSTGEIATGVGASYKWTVPDLVSKIPGKTSGTCTITCKTKSGSTVIGTKTVDLTLTIPAKSTPSASASTVQMGTSVNIYTNRKSSSYIHTLTYELGDASGTIKEDVEAGRTWTPPKSLAAYTGNKTSAVCTITCKTYNGSLLIGTATTQIILTVPDATVPTLSASTIAMGGKITISMPKEADVYTHDLSYAFEDVTGTIDSGVSADIQWTVPLSLAAEIPSATKGTITITCKTRFKDSTTVIGTETVSFTATVPNNSTTQPDVTMSVSAVETPFSGVYVAGKSKVKVSYDASSDYSDIKSYLTELLNTKSSANPFTSPLLANAGTVEITGKVTDARGYSTEKTASITVLDYSRPRIIPGEGKSSIICVRCNSDGKADPGGVYLLIQIGRKYSKVVSNGTQKNYCKLSYQWKTDAQADSEYSDPVVLLARTATSDHVSKTLSGIVTSNTTAYNIRLIAEDDVGETDTVTITVPTAFAAWHVPPGGHGFTLGGYHDPAKYDVFDCFFDAEFEGDVYGKVYGLGGLPMIPENADFNDYKNAGVYSVTQNAKALTITNMPVQKAGILRVWSANGSGLTTGNYVYMMQEFIAYDNSATYRRFMMLENDVWEYGIWKVVDGADAIIDQGLTDGWYWRKFANGTAECWKRVQQTVDIDTEWGGVYYGNCEEVTFPFSFYSAPIVNATVESGYALWLMSWTGSASSGTTLANKPASLRVARPTAVAGASIIVAYHAIGRWK